MNTIHTTSEKLVDYTILGGQNKADNDENGITLVLLKRRGRIFRKDIFLKFYEMGFSNILSFEDNQSSWDMEELTDYYPDLRFVLFRDKDVSTGHKINIAVQESVSDWIFVLWDDIKLEPLNPLCKTWIKGFDKNNTACIIPKVLNHDKDELPFLTSPMHHGKRFKTVSMKSDSGLKYSLFPYDYCGLYNRKLYPMFSGFDPEIKQPFWQKLDFGLRIYLWGGNIRYNSRIIIRYEYEPVPDDNTVTDDYLKFYLKNLAYEILKGEAVLRRRKLLRISFTSKISPVKLLKRFRKTQTWIKENRLRFKNDPETAINMWGVGE